MTLALRSRVSESLDGASLAAFVVQLATGASTRSSLRALQVPWPRVMEFAVKERCAALAWLRSEEVIRARAPAAMSAEWKRLYLTNAARGHAHLLALADAAALLTPHDIVPVTLKGAPLAARLYGDSAVRASSDTDWYIPLEKRETASRVLIKAGWERNEGGLPWDETLVRQSPHGRMYLEIHSSLLHQRFAYLPVPAPAFERVLVDGIAVRRHDGPLVPGYLATHLATHSAPPLLWYIDFATLWLSLAPHEQARATEAAQNAGLARYLRWAVARVALISRMAAGDEHAGAKLGFSVAGHSDVHPVWRHAWLAPSPTAAFRAVDGWLRPSWVAAEYGKGLRGVLRRVGRHWRAILGRRVSPDYQPGVVPGVAHLPSGDLLTLVREVTSTGGEMWIVVTGRSMMPAISPGDRLLMTLPGKIRNGDVVLADLCGRPLLHRVRKLTSTSVITRGDALSLDDAPFERADIIARASTLERDGVARPVPPAFTVSGTVVRLARGVARRLSGNTSGKGERRVNGC
jgi:hypothetical protein